MRIDIVHLLRVHLCIGQGERHRARRAVHRRGCRMMSVGSDPVAGELGVDVASSPPRALKLFQYDHSGSLAQDKAVSILVEGPTGFRWSVITSR